MVNEQERRDFIGRISEALGRKPTQPKPFVVQNRTFQNGDEEKILAYVAEAKERDFRPHVIYKNELLQTIKAIVEKENVQSLGCGSDEDSQNFGVKDFLEVLEKPLSVWDKRLGREKNIENFKTIDLTLTVAYLAIAETGTVIEYPKPDCGKCVSLLPRVHVSIVPATRMVMTMQESMQNLQQTRDEKRWPASYIHISGPSSTGDIESVLVTGVHGPTVEHIIIVKDI